MKIFLKKLLIYIIIPVTCIIISVILWDPFKIFFDYNDYYSQNPITLNRENVVINLFNRNPNKQLLNNFIIGNSRSQAFKTDYWKLKLASKNQFCFHYDGSAFGLYRAANAISYLDKSTNKLDNILLIVDNAFFQECSNPNGHLFIQPPRVSNESKFHFYTSFITASLNFNFISSNIIYNLLNQYYPFMGHSITSQKYFLKGNNSTGDVFYGADNEIKLDSISYYKKLIDKNIFYQRPEKCQVSNRLIYSKQLILLHKIRNIIKSNHCNLKIVIAPIYDEIQFNECDKKILINLFGKDNVFDFSGKNNFTIDFKNYYEPSHFKPYVANQIMDLVYTKP